MQRPRMIATREVLAEAEANIKYEPAKTEFQSLKKRVKTIFDMPLLSYEPPGPVARTEVAAETAAILALTAAVPTLEATPLDFLPTVDAFAPKSLGHTLLPIHLESLGFKPKGFSANEIAKAGLSRIQALGLLWHLSPESRYAERCIAEMKALCNLPHWGDQFLATATILQALAVGYDWLNEELDDATRRLVATAMMDKGIAPALAQFAAVPQPNWISLSNNWNIVCNASLIMAALALEPDVGDPRIAQVKQAALNSIKTGLTLLHDDGSWRLEGTGYWHLATEHLTYLLAAVATAEPGLLAAIETPGARNTGRYRCYMSGPTTLLFNFGDSSEQRPGLWWLRWLGRHYGLAHCHELAEDRTGATGAAPEVHPMDVIWRRTSDDIIVDPIATLPTAAIFCETAVLRGPWGKADSPYVGIKGGETSGRRSHSHLDLGHFVYEVGGHRWAIDLEPDEYSDCYLTPPERYRFYRAGSFGHNTLVIDGRNQSFLPFEDPQPPIAARFSGPNHTAAGNSIAVDLTAAYPAARSARRTFTLAEAGHLTLVDEIAFAAPFTDLTWSLHTRATVACNGPVAELTMPASATAPAARLLATIEGVAGAVFTAVPAGPAALYSACKLTETAAKGVTRLMVELSDTAADLRLVIRLTPTP